MEHVVELVIQRFYKVYVEDENNSMTEDQIVEAAKKMALESEDNLSLVDELEIEPQDIVAAQYEYDI